MPFIPLWYYLEKGRFKTTFLWHVSYILNTLWIYKWFEKHSSDLRSCNTVRTMLQKLLICEVKIAQSGNSTILMSTQIWREIKFWRTQTVKKSPFSYFYKFWILFFVNLTHFLSLKFIKIERWESLRV